MMSTLSASKSDKGNLPISMLLIHLKSQCRRSLQHRPISQSRVSIPTILVLTKINGPFTPLQLLQRPPPTTPEVTRAATAPTLRGIDPPSNNLQFVPQWTDLDHHTIECGHRWIASAQVMSRAMTLPLRLSSLAWSQVIPLVQSEAEEPMCRSDLLPA